MIGASSDGGPLGGPPNRAEASIVKTDIGPARARVTGPRALNSPSSKGERTLNHHEAAATLAAALNDPDRSLIGNPRERVYKVALRTSDMKEALAFARHLALFRITPSTTITHDDFGGPALAHVNIYAKDAQRRLFAITQSKLDPTRRELLEDLILARGPIPDGILEKIWVSYKRGRSPSQIAERMNEFGVIAGMGGVRWTKKKVWGAVREYERRLPEQLEAA